MSYNTTKITVFNEEKAKDEDMYNKYMSAYSKINITKGR